MAANVRVARGRILIVQEDRIRLKGDDGTVLLLTVPSRHGIGLRELQQLDKTGRPVVIEYEGEPNLGSGVVRSIRDGAPRLNSTSTREDRE